MITNLEKLLHRLRGHRVHRVLGLAGTDQDYTYAAFMDVCSCNRKWW